MQVSKNIFATCTVVLNSLCLYAYFVLVYRIVYWIILNCMFKNCAGLPQVWMLVLPLSHGDRFSRVQTLACLTFHGGGKGGAGARSKRLLCWCRRPLHRPEAGAVVELGRVELRARRPLLPLPRSRSSQGNTLLPIAREGTVPIFSAQGCDFSECFVDWFRSLRGGAGAPSWSPWTLPQPSSRYGCGIPSSGKMFVESLKLFVAPKFGWFYMP